MSKLTPFEELFSQSERALIERWATTKFVPRERPFKTKPMETQTVRYKLIHTHEGREVSGLLEYTDKKLAVGFADAMNKKFPGRRYHVVPVRPTTGKERMLELVN